MRRLDDDMIDPEIEAALDAIDATMAGEPVDPEHAELAELALLLAASRPEVEPGFARSLDERVARRFERPRRFSWKAAAGVLAPAAAAAVVVVLVIGKTGPSTVTPTATQARTPQSSSGAAGAASTGGASQSFDAKPAPGTSTGSSSNLLAAPAPATAAGAPATSAAAAPQPPNNGRRVVQSAELALTAPPTRVDDVAQETFDVIGRENGIVRRSSVTATGGSDGYAQFLLSVPSASLSDTMNALSRLHFAHVASRTDSSQDVNDTYVSVTRQLADARALRASLLKQLAGATTPQQTDSLNARIHDVEGTITRAEAQLRNLNRQINFSQISLTISAGAAPVTHSGSGSGFTIGKALHDAGRVLTVAAGVALIALAVLVPLGLLGALVWWAGTLVRRRRREQALDVA
jgi:Domain of unknown function (DUF4349)